MWFNFIKSWYESGKWTKEDVQRAVGAKRITQTQADVILA